MKNIIRKICAWLISWGADKWLYVLIAMIIAELIMLIPLPISGRVLLAVWTPVALDLVKETTIDTSLDAMDMWFTLIGGALGAVLSTFLLMV